MSKENENRNEESDVEENLEDSEETTEESKEQEDKDNVEEQLQEKDKKIKELEALIVKNKKKDKGDNQDSEEESKKVEGDYLTKEEAVLLKEMDIEDLDKLKAVQKGEEYKSLKEARESDLFTAYLDRKKAEKKKKEAQLGSSRGSGGGDKKFKPGMTREEHKKAWDEAKS